MTYLTLFHTAGFSFASCELSVANCQLRIVSCELVFHMSVHSLQEVYVGDLKQIKSVAIRYLV